MTTWFTSDLHFNHVNIMNYGRSNFFGSLDEMNEAIIANHNSVVAPDDTVYVLGDVVMGKRDVGLPFLDRMNGQKILIMGNHDYPHPTNPQKVVDKWTDRYAEYFDGRMYLGLVIWIGPVNGMRPVTLSHFPGVLLDHTDDVRYEEYHPVDAGMPVIHGHLHCEEISVAPNNYHIGIDADYTAYGIDRYHPIPLSLLESIILNGG